MLLIMSGDVEENPGPPKIHGMGLLGDGSRDNTCHELVKR